MRQNGTNAGEENVRSRWSLILENIWLRMQLAFSGWRLRRRGIDPDTLAGMDELRRQHEEGLAKLKREGQRERVPD
jgi:hypothetical protein